MAQWATGSWLSVKQLIELFVYMGCELREEPPLSGPEGEERVRYLYNPATGGFQPLTDLEDDERLPPSEVEAWQRRLGTEIPTGPKTH